MTISKTSLAIERHNLKNILVKLKAQDTLVNWLQNKIENLQKDNHENIIEEIQKWIIEGIEIRAERRKSVNEQLDSLPRVNPSKYRRPNDVDNPPRLFGRP
jgi:regulatory protein YycI of two-component signal transduction system YycFG